MAAAIDTAASGGVEVAASTVGDIATVPSKYPLLLLQHICMFSAIGGMSLIISPLQGLLKG
jgi:hypothetical protein